MLEKTLDSPLGCKEIQPVLLKEISPGCSLEGLMLKLKLQYFGHLMRRADSLEKTLMMRAGGERDSRGWDGWMTSLTQWTWVWVDSGNWWWTGSPGVLWFIGSQRVDTTERLNWTECRINRLYCKHNFYNVLGKQKIYVTCFIVIFLNCIILEPNLQYLQGMPTSTQNELKYMFIRRLLHRYS